MRKLLLLLLIPWLATAQTTKTGRVMTGTLATRPAACSPGDQFNTTDGNGAYLCNPTTNTWQAFAGTNQALLPNTVVPFSATPSFNTTLNQMFSITLTGNVTSSTASGSPVNGSVMKLHICQGAGAPWTFAFPANFLNVTPIQTSGCTDQTYNFDGTNWSQVTQPAGAGGGGGSPPGGANNDPQCNNATTSFKACAINPAILYASTGGSDAATGLSWDTAKQTIGGACAALPGGNSSCTAGTGTIFTTSPSIVLPSGTINTISLVLLNKLGSASSGPNPVVDVTTFGVRALLQSAIPVTTGVTASITATQNTATVSTNTCASQPGGVCFVQGDGVVIYGAGATCTLTTPVAPTVTPSVDSGPVGTGATVTGPAGSTTWQYQVVATDKNGCVTASSPVTSISTGQTLGLQSVNITSCSRSGNVATCLTASPHTLSVGSQVYIYQTTDDPNFGGPQIVATVPDSTHFTYTNGIDLRNGGTALSDLTGTPTVGISAGNGTSATGGTARWFNVNKISVTSVASTWEYCLYGRTSGAMAWINCGRPQGNGSTSTITDLNLYDYGSTMEGNRLRPAWIPNTPPGAIQNDWLATTINSISSLTLTLATNASNTVSGNVIRHDNYPNLINAANFATQIGHGGSANYLLYFPVTPNGLFYDFASYMLVPQNLHMSFNGQPYMNGTMEVQDQDEFTGNVNRAGWPAGGFGQSSGADVFVNEAYPGIYGGHFRYVFDHLTFTSSVQNGAVPMIFDQVQPFTMEDTTVISSTSSANGGLDIPIIFRGQGGTSGGGATSSYVLHFKHVYFAGGGTSFWPNFTTDAPAFWCNGCGIVNIDHLQLNQRTLATAGANLELDSGRVQGGMGPFLSLVTCGLFGCGGNTFSIRHYEFDTYYGTLFTDYTAGNGGNNVKVEGGATACISGGEPSLSGAPDQISWDGLACPPVGQNHDITMLAPDGQANLFNNTAQLYYTRREIDSLRFPGNQRLIFDLSQIAAPTATLNTGTGSMAPNTYTFYVLPVGFDGGVGVRSLPSNTCTTTGANLSCTVSWTKIPGAASYYLAFQTGGGACISNNVGNVNTFTFNVTPANNFGCFIGGSGSGLTYAEQGEIGSPQLRFTSQTNGFSGLQVQGPLTGNRTYTWPDQTGTVVVSNTGNIVPGTPNFALQYGVGTVFTGLAPSTAPNNVPKIVESIAVGGLATAPQQALQGVVPRASACPSNADTVLPTDRANRIAWTDASQCNVTLPQAGSGGGGNLDFTSNFFFKGCNTGTASVVITPTISTINGNSTLTLSPNQCASIFSDNTNYTADKSILSGDYPERFYVPAANCNNTSGSPGWSIGASGVVVCRAGTNNKGGAIQITETSATFAQFTITMPLDWDTNVNPYIRFFVASTDNTSGHLIIPEFQVSCSKGDGSTTDDVAFNAFHSSSTITLNTTANQFWSNSFVQMNNTDMTGCVPGALMTVNVGRATESPAATNANFYGATVTFPRLLNLGAE